MTKTAFLLLPLLTWCCTLQAAGLLPDTLRTDQLDVCMQVRLQASGNPALPVWQGGDTAGIRQVRHWVTFVVRHEGSTRDTVFLVNDRYRITWMVARAPDGGVNYLNATGLGKRVGTQRFPDFPHIAAIPLAANTELQVFVGTEAAPAGTMPVYSAEGIYRYIYELRSSSGLQIMINTLGLGFLSFVFIFFLFYSLVARQRLYTLYTLYLGMALFFCLTMHNELAGYAQTWINQFAFLRRYNESAVALMFVFYIFFGDQLLEISRQSRLLGRIFRWVAVALVGYGTFHLICRTFGIAAPLVTASYVYFRLIFLPVYAGILVLIILQVRSPLKPFLLIANGCLLAGVTASVAVDLTSGIWTVGHHVIYPGAILQLGIVGETICFSLALGYYAQLIRRQRDERAIAQSEMEKRLMQVSARSLEAQMNPHFLFNGLNVVRDLVMKGEKEHALKYMNTLAVLLRTSLINSRKEYITLAEELESTRHYLAIEQLRLGSDFTFTVQADPDSDLQETEVPPRMLQPIVENAVRHGLRPSQKPRKTIDITVARHNGTLTVSVADNGIGLHHSDRIRAEDPLKGTRMGLALTRERLALFNERQERQWHMEAREQVSKAGEVQGTVVTFTLTTKHGTDQSHYRRR